MAEQPPRIRTRITPRSVGPPERLSSDAETFPVTVDEDVDDVRVAIFSRRGAEGLQEHIGHPVGVVLEEGDDPLSA